MYRKTLKQSHKAKVGNKAKNRPKERPPVTQPPASKATTPAMLNQSIVVRHRSGRCTLTPDALAVVGGMLGVYLQELHTRIAAPAAGGSDPARENRLAEWRRQLSVVESVGKRFQQTWPTNDVWACSLIVGELFGEPVAGPHAKTEGQLA